MYNEKRKICCSNCGEEGHVYKYCPNPIISLGIIAYTENKNNLIHSDKLIEIINSRPEYISNTNNKRYLLIQRRDSMGYVDLIRGKYNSDKLILSYFNDMTYSERYRLKTHNFYELWNKLWVNHNCKCYINELENAKTKFESLDINHYLNITTSKWTYPEWGLPKGRRNLHESDIDCAKREFIEETGYTNNDFKIINELEPVIESFIGSNGINYIHKYYIARINDDAAIPKLDQGNLNQYGEIGDIGLFTLKECMMIVRPHQVIKKQVILTADSLISKYNI